MLGGLLRLPEGDQLAGEVAVSRGQIPPVLRDGSGAVIELASGNTWFQVIANDQNISMK